jgi:hypothetical protein
MGDVIKEHPEFFKAPSERDAPPAEAEISEATAPASESEPGHGIDEILEGATLPLLTETNPVNASRSRRTAAGLFALFGGVLFSLLYAAAVVGVMALRQSPDAIFTSALSFVVTPMYWLTTMLFTGLFALLAVIAGRGTWAPFVIGSFFVALLTYIAAVGAGLIAIHAWELTFVEARTALWEGIAFSPLILIAPILGREIPLWLGLWISRRDKRLRGQESAAL